MESYLINSTIRNGSTIIQIRMTRINECLNKIITSRQNTVYWTGMSDEFSFLIDDSMLLDASDIAIGRQRPSETIRTLNDSELKSIVSGNGEGNGSGGESASIVAICEGRGTLSEIGFSIFDTQSNVCHIIQYSDTSNYSRTMHLLTIHPPLRILMCSSATENHRSKLYQTLLDVFPLDSLCFLTRSDFNEGKGRDVLERLCVPKLLDGVLFGCTKKYYAYSAVSALFHFIERELNLSLVSRSLKFVVKPSDGTLSLDYHTCKSLELISNGSYPRSQSCLLGVLCKCQTAMGRRLMRTSLLQPLTDLIEINERQEAIQLLLENEVELHELREALKRFPDIDNFLSNLVRRENSLDPKCGEDLIHRALLLKKILGKTGNLLGTLRRLDPQGSTLISSIIETLNGEGIETIFRMIEQVINEDISYSEKTSLQHHQRFYAVKSNDSTTSLLEVARRTLKEIQSDIYEYVEAWSGQIDLPVDIKYQSKRGYYLSVRNRDLGDRSLEGICSQYKRGRSEVTFTTMDLIKLNGRVKESMTEVLLASQTVLNGLFDALRERIEIIYEVSAAAALLDFICGLSQWALDSGSVCRPEFAQSGSLTIRQSRHPILEAISPGSTVVANDYFSCRGNSFAVITGANMSGKSTYSKQLALLCVMAQMGSFLPAEYAAFPIYDRLLTRLGSDDELESNASSFRMEMKESAYILEMLTDSSLVIIDELGRGTSYLEGLSLAMSICESILSNSEATVMFVTHFSQLTRYLKLHPKVSMLHLQSEISPISRDLRFLYRATSGSVEIEDYGMRLAERSGLPRELMGFAWDALEVIKRTQGDDTPESSGIRSTLQRRKLILQTAEKIKFIQKSEGIEAEVKEEMLKKIKEDFEISLEK